MLSLQNKDWKRAPLPEPQINVCDELLSVIQSCLLCFHYRTKTGSAPRSLSLRLMYVMNCYLLYGPVYYTFTTEQRLEARPAP